jgi:hypothetical protein
MAKIEENFHKKLQFPEFQSELEPQKIFLGR